MTWKQVVCSLVSIYFNTPRLGYKKRNICIKLQIINPEICSNLVFEIGVEIGSLPHFLYNFSRKVFLILNSINLPNIIFCLLFHFQILANMCIIIICFPGCGIINFEINLIRLFFYMIKKSRQKFKYLENKKSF